MGVLIPYEWNESERAREVKFSTINLFVYLYFPIFSTGNDLSVNSVRSRLNEARKTNNRLSVDSGKILITVSSRREKNRLCFEAGTVKAIGFLNKVDWSIYLASNS